MLLSFVTSFLGTIYVSPHSQTKLEPGRHLPRTDIIIFFPLLGNIQFFLKRKKNTFLFYFSSFKFKIRSIIKSTIRYTTQISGKRKDNRYKFRSSPWNILLLLKKSDNLRLRESNVGHSHHIDAVHVMDRCRQTVNLSFPQEDYENLLCKLLQKGRKSSSFKTFGHRKTKRGQVCIFRKNSKV